MRLANPLFFCTLMVMLTGEMFSQSPWVQIKVRESGLFGLKAERYAKVELADRSRAIPLTSDSVSSGSFYYFILQPIENWTLDDDFVKEEIPKLTIMQSGQTISAGWKSELTTDSTGTSILLGFPKTFRLNQPFDIQFSLDGTGNQVEFRVPQNYWPGFDVLQREREKAARALGESRFTESIAVIENLMRSDSLQIFYQASELKDQRTKCFNSYVEFTRSSFLSAAQAPAATLREKIQRIDELRPQLQFVVDSLPTASLKIGADEPAIRKILDSAAGFLMKVKTTRDSLQRALDDLNARWICEGAATGKNGPQFEKMIEALAYAFSSLDFGDSTLDVATASVPAGIRAGLEKSGLMESYATFMRQSRERFQRRLPLFPEGFLSNLRKDTTSFPLPYYSMLKAVQDYFGGDYSSTLSEIREIFRTCYDPELSQRFDKMRVLSCLHVHGWEMDVMSLLDEAEAAEKKGDRDLASDRYGAALRLAPHTAYPAYLCAQLYARTGDPIRARSFYERAFEIDSLYLSAYREAWRLYQAAGNYKAMIEVLSHALSCGNDYWETNLNLGIAYLGDGDLPRAIGQFERALKLNPNNYQTNVQLGLAHQTAKNYQKAREYYNKAIFIDPHRLEAVESLQKLDDVQKAQH